MHGAWLLVDVNYAQERVATVLYLGATTHTPAERLPT